MAEKTNRSTHQDGSSTFITVKVQPRSSENGVSEIMTDGTIKIQLTAPPVEGKANDALITYLSELLEVRKLDVTIKSGQTSRLKTIKISSLPQEAALKKITAAIKRK